jgi:hypothetical protein
MKTRILLPLLVLVLAVLGVTACGGNDDGDSASGQAGASTMEAGGEPMHAATTTAASDLRSTLETLLGEHAVLAMTATQKGLAGDPDFEAVAAALDANGVALSEAIGSVYGDEAAEQFLDGPSLWRDHISFFVDYTVGLAEKDKAAQREAVENLTGYTGAFSGFLAGATGLPQAALQESTAEHVVQLKGQIDAYAAGDYEEAYRLFREAYAHMVMTGATLADAIVAQNPDAFGR